MTTTLTTIAIQERQFHLDTNNETIFATSAQIADIFGTTRQNIELHLKNIFSTGELDANSVCKKSLLTGNDKKGYNVKYYNLDAIISVGYRVNSSKATNFRKEATKVLKEYLTKGEVKKTELSRKEILVMALQMELDIEKQNKQLAIQEEAINLISDTQDTYGITEASKNLNLKSSKKLFDYLREKKWIIRLSDGVDKSTYYSHSYARGLNYMIDKQVLCKKTQKYYHQARITKKGMSYLIKHRKEIEV